MYSKWVIYASLSANLDYVWQVDKMRRETYGHTPPLSQKKRPLDTKFFNPLLPKPAGCYCSAASRHDFVNRLTFDAGLGVMFNDRFPIGCIEDAIDFVVFFTEQYIVVRYPKFIRWGILQFFQGISRKWLHGVSIDELRHGRSLLSTR